MRRGCHAGSIGDGIKEKTFPPLGDLPEPGIKPASPTLAGRFFITEPPGKPSAY